MNSIIRLCGRAPVSAHDHAEDVIVDAGIEAIDADLVVIYLGYYND
jgi:hypothetical protein